MERNTEYSYLRNKDPLDIPYTTIPEMILRHSQRNPKSVVQVYVDWETFDKEYLTFTDLYKSSSNFARGLVHLGIQKGDILALGADNSREWITAVVGIQMCGAIPLMFNFKLQDGSDIESTMTKVGNKCKGIVFPRGRTDKNVAIVKNILKNWEKNASLKLTISMSFDAHDDHLSMSEICKMDKLETSLPPIDPEDVGAIFQTSGSTGDPKLIPHTHLSILTAGFYLSRAYGNHSSILFNDRTCSWIGGWVYIRYAS